MTVHDDDAQLQAASAQIEQLLCELRELVPLPAFLRVEQLARRIVQLYAAGLARTLDHARAAGAALSTLGERLSDDDLVSSLLVLHGLHPLSTEQRVRRALRTVTTELGLDDDALVVVELREDQLHLRANATLGGGAMSAGAAEGMVRRVVEAAAPELTSIRITGLPAARDPSLVQLRTPRQVP